MQHLVLVDGHHLMYRAYFAIPPTFKNSKGEQTNAIYGVTSMLISMLKLEQPDSLVFCFDKGEETFRHQENATYKDGRAETPDDFFVQIPRIVHLIETFGIVHVSDAKYEADDFLCAYAKAGEAAGMRVTIVTGDRDAFQLATEHVRVSIPHKGYQQPEYLGPAEIIAKYGIRPDQVPSYKGLCGDASDNLPGVKGIGPKTAAELLQKYDTLQGIYTHLEELRPAVRAKLEADKEQAFFCEHMAQLVCMPLPRPLEDVALSKIPLAAVRELFRELEFSTLQNRLDALAKTPYGLRYFVQSETPKPTVPAKPQLSLFE
jgi:DNA polymerase-1